MRCLICFCVQGESQVFEVIRDRDAFGRVSAPFSQTMAELELVQCLSSTLSPDANTRITAELRLSELLKSPDAGLALSRIIVTHELEMSLRQMSTRPSSTTSPVT